MEKRPALGKGLSALIPDAPEPPRRRRSRSTSIGSRRTTSSRARTIDDARLEELAQSIKANGVIQPIVVRRIGDRFQIIAGERRWRAAQRAGLLRVPVVVRDVAPGQERSLLEMALDRKHPARGSEPDRRGARLPAARRRIPADAGGHRRGGRQGSRVGRQLPAAAEAARRGPRRSRVGPLSMGHARALLVARRRSRAAPRRARRDRAQPVGARDRSARQEDRRRRRRRPRAAARRSRSTCTRAPPKSGCSSRSARACASSAAASAAASRSISSPKTS